MTDEQLEKQINEEFEKWRKSETTCPGSMKGQQTEAFTAAALPREKRIRELESIIERGDEIKNNWENNCYQEAARYNWLDDQTHEKDQLIFNLEVRLKEAEEVLSKVNDDWLRLAKMVDEHYSQDYYPEMKKDAEPLEKEANTLYDHAKRAREYLQKWRKE